MAASSYTVERSTVIAASPEDVYEQIADFHKWADWSPWEGLDPNMGRTYSGSAAGKGAIYRWSGNRQAGQGRMEILQADFTLSRTGIRVAGPEGARILVDGRDDPPVHER